MSKSFGSTRIIRESTLSRAENRDIFNKLMKNNKYIPGFSYFSKNSNGYMLYMKGHNYSLEEIEMGKYAADKGFVVVLTPEGDGFKLYGTRVTDTGYKFSEGTLAGITYEQKTPERNAKDAVTSVFRGIEHAHTKRASVAAIYDRYGKLHREDIEEGMKLFQKKYPRAWGAGKLVAVWVMNKKGVPNEHQFDKKG